MKRLHSMLVAALAVSTVAGADAYAQNEDFNAVVQEGMRHYRARQYDQAIDKFEAAYAISPQPELIYNVARAYEKGLKRDEAMAAYERFLSLPGTTADLRAKALRSLNALRQEKAAMQAANNPPPPPATAAAPPPAGGVQTAAPRAERSRTLEWVLIGGGLAVAAAGGVFGVLALQADSDFDDAKAANPADPTLADKKKTVDDRALAADVLVGVGAVSAVAGIILFLATGDDDGNVAVAPTVGPDYAGIGFSGRF